MAATGIFIALYFLAILTSLEPERPKILNETCTGDLKLLTGEWQLDFVKDLDRILYHTVLKSQISRHHRKITSGYPLKNSINICQTFTKFTFLSLILSGDIALNPGPVKYPCGSCEKPVKSNQHGILCDGCEFWHSPEMHQFKY